MALRNASTATPEAIQQLAEDNLAKSIKIKQLEAMIDGLMTAMKPLLDEWSKLKANAPRAKESG